MNENIKIIICINCITKINQTAVFQFCIDYIRATHGISFACKSFPIFLLKTNK